MERRHAYLSSLMILVGALLISCGSQGGKTAHDSGSVAETSSPTINPELTPMEPAKPKDSGVLLTLNLRGDTGEDASFSSLANLIRVKCLACHSSEKPFAKKLLDGASLSMSTKQKIMERIQLPKQSAKSMPPSGPLTPQDIAIFLSWEEAGFPDIDGTKGHLSHPGEYKITVTGSEETITEREAVFPWSRKLPAGDYTITISVVGNPDLFWTKSITIDAALTLEVPSIQANAPSSPPPPTGSDDEDIEKGDDKKDGGTPGIGMAEDADKIRIQFKGFGDTLNSVRDQSDQTELAQIANKARQSIQKYCYECHSNDQNKINFATSPIKSRLSMPQLQGELERRLALDLSHADVMPPKSIRDRPSKTEQQAILNWASLNFAVPSATLSEDAGDAVMRVEIEGRDGNQTFYSAQLVSDFLVPKQLSKMRVSVRIDQTWKEVFSQRDQKLPKSMTFDVSPNQLSPDYLNRLIKNYNIASVEELIDQLPPEYLGNFSLMRESKSRHQSSLRYPRILSYGNDASLVIGVSTHPEDPAIDEVEVAFFDQSDYRWKFFLGNFKEESPTFFDTTNTCSRCHGNPARPIWGAYPEWPGAIGDGENGEAQVLREEYESLQSVLRNPENNPRLSKFDFAVDYDDRYDTYYFNQNNNRSSGDMLGLTMEISARHSYSLFKRLNPEQANYSKYESAYLFDQICSKTAFEKLWKGFAQAEEDTLADEVGKTHRNLVGPTLAGTQYHYLSAQLLELLGFDAANELILELRKDEIDHSGETYYSALSHQGFFAGEESLNSLLGFLMLHQLAHGDSEVNSVLHHSQMDKMDSLYELTWGLTGKAKESAFSSIRSAEDYEFYYFSRFLEDLRLNSSICPLLIARALK